MSESIRVVVRIRPINSKELSLNCQSIVTAHEDNNQISILKPDEPEQVKTFAYDSVFSDTSLQSNVYAKTAYALVQNVLQGYNGTIFAYGQTGCGKTHSMVGKLDVEELKGIIPRSFGHILNTISETKNRQFLIRCSFIEIYNEEVRDLLGKDVKKSLEIKQSPDKGVFIKDLSSNPAKTHDELMDYMNLGNRNRSVGETAMNKDSSRSHLLFMLYLESADLSVPEENRKYIGSKLNLVDLAGSERINKTGAQGERLQEAKSINLSLSALGNVISALVDGKSHHIPYRDSKLTRLLQDSLGGNTKTVMIANCSPADYNFDETISTLRYASRAKFIKNKPIINEDPKDALLKEYSNEIKKLKDILSKQGGCPDFSDLSAGSSGELGEKMKEKEMELANEKQETRMLQERLKALEKQHLLGENVKVDKKIKQNLQVVRKCSIIQIPAQSRIPGPDDSKGMKFTTFPSQIQLQSNQQNHKQVIKTLKNQIKNLEGEIEDVQHENYLDKELILGDIRNLSKENKLLEGIINFLLSPKELEIIKERIERVEKEQHQKPNPEGIVYGYNQDKNQYVVPKFTTREKDIILPKLAQNQEDGLEIKSNKVTEKNINNRRSVLEDKSYKLVNEDKYAIKSNHKPGDDVPALEIKNSSFVSGKPKENGGQGIDKKNMGKIRPLIQEAREANESLFYESSSPKKNLPSQLQPLGKPEMQEKLQRMLQNEKEKENKGLERPKKLEKLNFPSGKVSPAKRD